MSNEVTQWEYKTVGKDIAYDEKELNNLGKAGWEITGMASTNGYTQNVILKRPKTKDDDYGYSR